MSTLNKLYNLPLAAEVKVPIILTYILPNDDSSFLLTTIVKFKRLVFPNLILFRFTPNLL